MSEDRVYVIGDRGNGVVLLRTNPLRVVVIEDSEITKYTTETGKDGYATVAGALWRLVSDLRNGSSSGGEGQDKAPGVESLVTAGVVLSEADFAFVTKVGASSPDPNMTVAFETQMTVDQMTNIMTAGMTSQMTVEMTAEMNSQMTVYSPAAIAIGKLFGQNGDSLQQAVLADTKQK